MGVGQTEYHLPVKGAHVIGELRYPGGKPFAQRCHYRHHYGYIESVPSRKYHLDIDEHSHADEKVRDENGVAHKLDAVHQRRHIGDVAVHDDASEESAKHALKTYKPGGAARQKHHGEYKYELHHAVAVVLEKPSGDARKQIDDRDAVYHKTQQQHQHFRRVELSVVMNADTHRKHNQRAKHRHDGTGDGDNHRGRFCKPEPRYDRVGDKGVGGIHRREKYRREPVKMKKIIGGDGSQYHWDEKRVGSESHPLL